MARQIAYNRLNLIEKVEQDGSTLANYSYLADGTKLSATDADGDGLYYFGSLVYRKQNGAFELESAAFDGGRFFATSSGVETRYYIADHLGSVRVIVDDNGEVIERNDFYPFGLRWDNAAAPIADNRYRYNAKEEQAFLALPYIDYGARMYDPKYNIRWNSVDPLAEKYLYLSPFAFCGNDPINYIDPDGRRRRIIYDKKNKIITVQATYYCYIYAISHVQNGINVFNKLTDMSYTDEHGDTYQVKFQLTAKHVHNPENKAKQDIIGNYIDIKSDLGVNKNGYQILGNTSGINVQLTRSSARDPFVVAHEIGHTLGAALKINGVDNHAPEGLMVDNVDHPKKAMTLDQKSIDEIITAKFGPAPIIKDKLSLWERIKGLFTK